MFGSLDTERVLAISAELGIGLSRDEAEIYRDHLIGLMNRLDGFMQSRIEESHPPDTAQTRKRGHRPSATEDPLNAWMWRCEVTGSGEGVLAGKTVSFKDHIAVAGVPMSFGTLALEGLVPDFDATIVTRVLEAGGVVIGKNVMNGLSGGYAVGGSIGDFGRPLNPHDHERVTGGSSSGSAAAVAANEVDVAFGGDQGGSVRIPAAYCGIVGHKPTFGLVSHFGVGFGSDQSIDYVGPLSRTVEGAARALEATAGVDPRDPRQSRDVPRSLDVLSTLFEGVEGLRVGLLDEGFLGVDEDVRDGVVAAVEVLAGQGARVSRISVPEHDAVTLAQAALSGEGALALFRTGFFGMFAQTHYPAEIITAINRMWEQQAELLSPRAKLTLLAGALSRNRYQGGLYAKAQNVRATYIQSYDVALTEVDVIVMPTVPTIAPRSAAPEDYLAAVDDNIRSMKDGTSRNTAPFNFTGHPALAIPVGTSEGMPISMQLVGRRFEDPLLFRVAHAYERAVAGA